MKLEEVLPAYREGKAITRKGWKGKDGYANDERGWYYDLTREDVNADDWLILDDKVILTREQFERAWDDALSKVQRDTAVRLLTKQDLWEELKK